MNWDDPQARLSLAESVGPREYNRLIKMHIDARPSIYPVQTRFGILFAVKGTDMAFATRTEAEAYREKIKV